MNAHETSFPGAGELPGGVSALHVGAWEYLGASACRCVCSAPAVPPPPIGADVLAAFGLALVGVGAFAYAVGRVKRIRSRLQLKGG